jgi:tRNA G18 (ribose-2'-O)-methylase SpoU
MTNDSRNVLDEFKTVAHDDIVRRLDERGVELEIAIENTLRDYNMGTIVRTANAFGVRTIHVIGRKQWNKRGAMMTDKYLSVLYYASPKAFSSAMQQREKAVYALENNVRSTSIFTTTLIANAVLLFGQEGPGISKELLAVADQVVSIDQSGSTRSMNVGVAAGIAMYEWVRQNQLK